MAGLIRFALSQRLLVMILVLLLCGGGYLAFKNIPIDAFPEVSPTQVKIIVKAPGMILKKAPIFIGHVNKSQSV